MTAPHLNLWDPTVVPVTNHDQQLQAQVEKIARKLEELELKSTPLVNEVRVEKVCEWCERHGHIVTECPSFIAAKRAQQSYQVEGHEVQGWDPYSQTYDQGWSSHPNYSWSDPNPYGGGQAQYPAPPPPEQPYEQPYYPWPQEDQLNHYAYTQVLDGPNPPFDDPPPEIPSLTRYKQLRGIQAESNAWTRLVSASDDQELSSPNFPTSGISEPSPTGDGS